MVSIKATGMIITLLIACVLASETSAAHKCCRSYMKTKLPFPPIIGYSVQSATGVCHKRAIIFHTVKGKEVCTDPALTWVMDYINRLRTKAQHVHNQSLRD